MLRSFSYAASAALFDRAAPGDENWGRLAPVAAAWEHLARQRFLNAYLTKSYEGRFLPAETGDLVTLLDFFELDKALYEVRYELGHRPLWLPIPLEGIRRVIERGAS